MQIWPKGQQMHKEPGKAQASQCFQPEGRTKGSVLHHGSACARDTGSCGRPGVGSCEGARESAPVEALDLAEALQRALSGMAGKERRRWLGSSACRPPSAQCMHKMLLVDAAALTYGYA